jgi:hypothetical protein
MTDHTLPHGWSISVRPDGPLTVLTLRNNNGSPQTTDYHGPTTGPAHTVHCLDAIADEALHTTAQRLVNRHFHQVDQIHATATALCHDLPDWDTVTARLQDAVPECRADAYRGHDGRFSLVLTATDTAAGRLLTLITTWPHATPADTDELPDGITLDLDGTTTLAVTLDPDHTRAFLAWFHGEPHAVPATFHSNSPDELALLTYLLENAIWAGALSGGRHVLAQQMLSRLGVAVPSCTPSDAVPSGGPSDRPAH